MTLVAAEAFTWFGTTYAPGDAIDTAGWPAHAITELLRSAPVAALPTGTALTKSVAGLIFVLT